MSRCQKDSMLGWEDTSAHLDLCKYQYLSACIQETRVFDLIPFGDIIMPDITKIVLVLILLEGPVLRDLHWENSASLSVYAHELWHRAIAVVVDCFR